MKIILGYRKEWHFIVVGIGIALGFLMGLYMASEAQFNISEMRSVLTRFGADSSDARIQEMITQSQSVTSLGMTIMLGGIFHAYICIVR